MKADGKKAQIGNYFCVTKFDHRNIYYLIKGFSYFKGNLWRAYVWKPVGHKFINLNIIIN